MRLPVPPWFPFHCLESRHQLRKIEHARACCQQRMLANCATFLSACPQAFHNAYSHCASQFATTGLSGPLNIYDSAYAPLLARWLAKTKVEVDWPRLQRCWSRSFLGQALSRPAKSLPAPAQRRVALSKVAEYLSFKGFPHKIMFIKVPDKAAATAAKKIIAQAVGNTCLHTGAKRWIKSENKVCRAPYADMEG